MNGKKGKIVKDKRRMMREKNKSINDVRLTE